MWNKLLSSRLCFVTLSVSACHVTILSDSLNRKLYFLGATHDHFLIAHELNSVEQITFAVTNCCKVKSGRMQTIVNKQLLVVLEQWFVCEYAVVTFL